MELRLVDTPRELRTKLEGLIDAALPDCYWKRRFNRHWNELGLDVAWKRWREKAPIINESIIPLIESTIQEIRDWPFRSQQ